MQDFAGCNFDSECLGDEKCCKVEQCGYGRCFDVQNTAQNTAQNTTQNTAENIAQTPPVEVLTWRYAILSQMSL